MRYIAAAFLLLGLTFGCSSPSSKNPLATDTALPTGSAAPNETYPVTPVEGPGWLKHLGLNVSGTHFGQMGGNGPTPTTERREPELTTGSGNERSRFSALMDRCMTLARSDPRQFTEAFNEPFMLGGEDLYRLNCQSCHGPDGEGAPPEINSLTGPVQGTSVAFVMKLNEERGTPVDEDFARELASQAETDLRNRIQNGGEHMPPFEHLRGDEVESLLSYLEKLAGVSANPGMDLLVSESAARVGEHLVKGTCHVCHDATGPGGGHIAMMQGVIPSLASMPAEQSLSSVIRQVQYGSSGMMLMMGGERMPPFPYLTQEEAAAAYFYLVRYPPGP